MDGRTDGRTDRSTDRPTDRPTDSLSKSERLSANMELVLHKVPIISVMTYACPAWNLLQISIYLNCSALVRDKVLRTIGKFSRCIPVYELHMAFRLPYIYDYIMKWCRQQAEVVQNYGNANVGDIGKRKAWNRKYKRPKLGDGQVYGRSSV
jgi:hypothetical protein